MVVGRLRGPEDYWCVIVVGPIGNLTVSGATGSS
jgi:hypothetical protein